MPIPLTDEELLDKVIFFRKRMTDDDRSIRREAEMVLLHLYVPEMMTRISRHADSQYL